MDGFFTALNSNSGALQVLFAGAVAVATVVYAVLTWRLVSETKRMRRAQTDAKVTIAVSSHEAYLNFVDLVVRNEGVGPAYNVQFEVEQLGDAGDGSILERIQGMGFVTKGLDYFSPKQEIRSFLASMTDDFELKMNTRLRVRISYSTASGERMTDQYVLDFSIFRGIHQLGEPDLHTIASSLKSLAKDVGHLASGFHKLQVITQDKAEHQRQQEEYYEAARESAAKRKAANAESEEA